MKTLAAILLLAICGCIQAAQQCSPGQSVYIMAVAYGQYGGPPSLMENPPPIHTVPQEQICKAMVGRTHCDYLAMYDEDERAIYLADWLDFSTVDAASSLVHEYVHHFQLKTKGPTKDCADHLQREHQAYAIQAHVLEMSGAADAAKEIRRIAQEERCAP
jgi:hypothetical protein